MAELPEEVVLLPHARAQIRERRLDESDVFLALREPDQVVPSGSRMVAQKVITIRDKQYLLRVVVEAGENTTTVVTVYATSRIAKYRRKP